MEDSATSSAVKGPRDHCKSDDIRTLASLSEMEIQQVLKYHNSPEDIVSIFTERNINGCNLDLATKLDDFTNLGVEKFQAEFLLKLVDSIRQTGIPLKWLGVSNEFAEAPTTTPVVATPATPAALLTHAYEHYYKAGWLDDANSVAWLEQQAADGNNAAKAYLMQYLYGRTSDEPRARILAAEVRREALSRWLESTDAVELMHAECIMGYCCYCGLKCRRDFPQAVTWYRKSADRGHAEAQYRLGDCFNIGRGVALDRNEAVIWYRKAADQGHAYAQFMYAYCHELGQGVTKDRDQAVEWYRISAAQGNIPAISRLKYLGIAPT